MGSGTDCFREAVTDTKSDPGSDNVGDQMFVVNAKPLQYLGREYPVNDKAALPSRLLDELREVAVKKAMICSTSGIGFLTISPQVRFCFPRIYRHILFGSSETMSM